MEDEGSGSSSFNSSDGGSGSWSPGLSHKTNQHVSNREGLHFLPLKSWLNGKMLFLFVTIIIFTELLNHFRIRGKLQFFYKRNTQIRFI